MSALSNLAGAAGALSGTLDDYRWEQTSKRGDKAHLAERLIGLRSQRGWTRKTAANAAGIPEYSLRNYELMKSVPKEEHLLALANAYGVRPEALHFFNFWDAEMIAPAFFQLAETYGLEPYSDDSYSALKPSSEFMERFLRKWEIQYGAIESDGDRGDYERWKDNFHLSFDPSQFPMKYQVTSDGEWMLIEPWQNHCQATKIQALRESHVPPLTQADLAAAADVSLGAMRGYEQGVRVPKHGALARIAECLGVSRGALVFTDFGSPVQAAHALFQLAGDYALTPHKDGDEVFLVARSQGPERLISCWARRREDDDGESLQRWKDNYRYYGEEEEEWKSTFRPYYVKRPNGSLLITSAVCSDYLPFDERFKYGYPRA